MISITTLLSERGLRAIPCGPTKFVGKCHKRCSVILASLLMINL